MQSLQAELFRGKTPEPEPAPVSTTQIAPAEPVEHSAALESLCERADQIVAQYEGKRRPTWAPALVLEGELLDVVVGLDFVKPDQKPVARLWSRFTIPSGGAVHCIGFELRAGQARSGKKIFEALKRSNGAWSCGPKWLPPKEPKWWQQDGYARIGYPRRLEEFKLLVRAVELGAARVADFAGHADEQMRIGGVISGCCAICGRCLTDPVSLQRGIGPECFVNAGRVEQGSQL